MSSARRPHRVVVLLLAPLIGYDAVIPAQLLGEAKDADGRLLYDVTMASLDGAPVVTSSGYAITPQHDASALRTADTVVVPGTQIPGPRTDGTIPAYLATALATIRPGTRLVSICTGAFVLASAGLLDGRRATTHWEYADHLAALYPEVQVDADVLFTDDGDVLTSAGLSAGVDLCLHLLRADHGSEVANRVARHCVVPPWRDGGQAQYIERHVPSPAGESTAGARAWALERLDADVPALARQAGMSLRTFARRFREETGVSPGAWLIQQRVRHAQRLLEATDLPIDDVADQAGLGTAASLRAHLRTHAGVSPSAYRRTFRGLPDRSTA
ncbi:GlxA family transcriptional regulator [Nocardioides cynanchi]|uniref:GlxA family transcriptional regulator n=1 Tax=Nocardioides cynanchi TaxID=2558918 RepID=UPI0012488E2E|nr:helix-turn-helix domain-containing protein [Nocardioides cynanchi]